LVLSFFLEKQQVRAGRILTSKQSTQQAAAQNRGRFVGLLNVCVIPRLLRCGQALAKIFRRMKTKEKAARPPFLAFD
jgi:hypothetical protein